MNLNDFDVKKKSEEGAWVDIYAPDTTKTDMRIKVIGKDSATFKAHQNKMAQKQRQKNKGLSIPETEKMVLDAYVAATIDWENVYDDDKELPCDKETISKVYTEYSWIYEQVVEFVMERTNFLEN